MVGTVKASSRPLTVMFSDSDASRAYHEIYIHMSERSRELQ
jgi:hypothetical protein